MKTSLRRIALLVVCVYLLACRSFGSESLQGFYNRLNRASGNGESIPLYNELLAAVKGVKTSSRKQIESAIPSIRTSLQSKDATVRSYGELGLVGIAERDDSASILAPLTPLIGVGLKDPDINIEGVTTQVITMLRPAPPAEFLPLLIDRLASPDKSTGIGDGIIFAMMRIGPTRSDVLAAVTQYLQRRDVSNDTRTHVLNALGRPGITDPRLIATIGSYARAGNDEWVQASAMHALASIGPSAVRATQKDFQSALADPQVSPRVKEAAARALQQAP